VQLTLFRGTERVEVTITRATITIASAEYEILEGNIGYLKISRFGNDTVGIASKAANDFASAGVSGVVLDLRSNPGGLLNGSVEVSSLWLPRSTTVLEERRGDEVIRTFEANGSPILEGTETVVLINEGSASASEIVAGALRDNNAATLFGMNSFGKGSVQQLDDLRSGGTLKVTIARWFTPNGENIDKEGIAPDTEVDMTEEDYTNDRDPQLDAAVESLKQ
jgi:carboxyl-terminal processing protease